MSSTPPAATPPFPLTPAQRGMLFHHLRWSTQGYDLQQIVCTMREPFDAARLEASWARVAAVHEALRLRIEWQGRPEPQQSMAAAVAVPIAVHDLRAEVDATAAVQRWIGQDRRHDIDLSRAPLFRVAVLVHADTHWTLVWTVHHILLDGGSCARVLADVLRLYDHRDGSPPDLVRPALTFSAFVAAGEARDASADEAYWRGVLAGFTGPTPVVIDHLPVPGDEVRGEVAIDLDAAVSQRIQHTATEWGVGLNAVVQAAWALVLGRYTGVRDIVFGAVRAGRQGARWADMIGMSIGTVPVRIDVDPAATCRDWIGRVSQQWIDVRPYERTPLFAIQQWCGGGQGTPLFESMVLFDTRSFEAAVHALHPPSAQRTIAVAEQNVYAVTLAVSGGDCIRVRLEFDRRRIDEAAAARMAGHFSTALERLTREPSALVGAVDVLTDGERQRLVGEWNRTARPLTSEATLEQALAAAASAWPSRVALWCAGTSLTYQELHARADRLAAVLVGYGAGPGEVVGIATTRTTGLVVGLLAVIKAGAAYLPLDPEYPPARLRFMVEDAAARLVVADAAGRQALGDVAVTIVDAESGPGLSTAPSAAAATEDDLAYVIYTSGSTGQPKGVMVTQRNVRNFFAGMDERLGAGAGVWLAVTSLSFDISVLELLWTLARGFTVVLHAGAGSLRAAPSPSTHRPLEFSLFYFASAESADPGDKYRLLLDGARFADTHGFTAVWTPERHFHAFGGLYPSPAVVSAALAAVTTRVALRAGSVVLPLHHPARVAEDWAIVDNLSNGRVGVSFASGWQANDFVLNPAAFADAKGLMVRQIDEVRRLWRGDEVVFAGPSGPVPVRTLPRPVQPELPVWITAAGNPDTFRLAGEAGASVLTHLLGQSVADLAARIAVYRAAWRAAGHAGAGRVTVMLHTYIGESDDATRERVRAPMKRYLESSLSLMRAAAASFPMFQARGTLASADVDGALRALAPAELDALLEHAFARYYETGGLFGTVERALDTVQRLRALGVDEIASLIDFGLPTEVVLEGLARLDSVRQRATAPPDAARPTTIADDIIAHEVTHLQCTPSLAYMVVRDPAARPALARLQMMLVGGESLPPSLARELREMVGGRVVNMYGPTETTVWSTTGDVAVSADEPSVSIGTPIANTQAYVVTGDQLAPIGVPGELWLGGEGVARGYWQRPELTAERFVPDTVTGRPGRLYRTADLVRWREDATLEHLGRLDGQVKVRGHRIELGEIEARLLASPGVDTAVAVAREDTPGDVRLVGYVTRRTGATLDLAALAERLRQELPAFMVPADVVILDAIPRTPNGKVNRSALPPPNPGPAARGVLPLTSDAERRVAGVWCDVLGLPAVGADDNFFDLGGHSLLAVRLAERLAVAAGRAVPITDVFRFPTVRSLARHLEGEAPASTALDRAQSRASRRLSLRRPGARTH